MNNLSDIYKYNHYKIGYFIQVSFNRLISYTAFQRE